MSQPDIQTLKILLEREEADRETAEIGMRQAERYLSRVDEQMAQFDKYRADYIARWQDEFGHHGGIEILRCYRSYMGRLDEAISQLTAQQTHAQASLRRARTLLLEAETRVAGIRKLMDRRIETHERGERRREQKHTDEMAQRAAWLNRPGAAMGAIS
jgi:flagellar FliJ protein